MKSWCNLKIQGGLCVGAMQPGSDLVYGEMKSYRQHRAPPGLKRLYEQGDAAGTVLVLYRRNPLP